MAREALREGGRVTPASYLPPAYLLLGLVAVLLFWVLTGLVRK